MNISVISFYHDGFFLEKRDFSAHIPIPRTGELVITTLAEMCVVSQVVYVYHECEVQVHLDKPPGSRGISGNIGKP